MRVHNELGLVKLHVCYMQCDVPITLTALKRSLRQEQRSSFGNMKNAAVAANGSDFDLSTANEIKTSKDV